MKSSLYLLLPLVFIFAACAGRSPKDPDFKFAPISEYEEKVKVKPLEETSSSENKQNGEEKTTKQPKLGLEPVVKLEVKGKHKKKMSEEVQEPSTTKRLPEIEDSEGMNGRRPIVDPFHVGEKVTLMMTYFGVSAGDATLEVRPFAQVNGRKAYHFFSQMQSSSVFSMFYKLDDHCESFLDYEELVPLNYTLSATETKQLMEIRQFFDWKNKKADLWQRRVTKESGAEEKKKSWDLLPFSQNIYTALQYVRIFQLKDGKTYSYHVSDDGRQWDVKATVLRREILKTDLGNFKTIVVQPEVSTEGILKPMGEVYFWLTDDDRKFFVKFESKIKIGKIIGYLKGLEKGTP
jgi:hypothetical protein